MPHGAIHPGSLPLPPLIAREIPWQCSNDDHRRWDNSEPALEQPEQEETCISVSWKQTDRHVWVSSADPWRKAEAWKAQWWSVHPGAPASSCTTWHSRAPRSLQEGLASDSRCLPGSQSAWARHPGPPGLFLFTTAPGRAISEVASCFYYKWQGKVFNLSNWTGKYKVQLNFIFFNWSIVHLQCCVSFECTAKGFSYTYRCVCVFSGVQHMDYSPLGFFVHVIFQVRTLDWAAISFSSRSSQPRNKTPVSWVSALAGGFFTTSTTWETLIILKCLGREGGSLGPYGLPATHSKRRTSVRWTLPRAARAWWLPWAQIARLLRNTQYKDKSSLRVWPQLYYWRWFYPSYWPKCFPGQARITSQSRFDQQKRQHL